jgi:hypothetical protein
VTTSTTTSNGQHPVAEPPTLESMRQRPVNVHLLRGYGPLVVGAVLFVLMVLLAPTVAPEHIVERPVHAVSTTTTTTAATSSAPTTPTSEATAP